MPRPVIISLLIALTPAAASGGPATPITLEELRMGILARPLKVQEFLKMRETAKELGIPRVYLLGNPAASFAHYVLNDLEREKKGLPDNFGRFDDSYESIFDNKQHIDVVLDTDNFDLVSQFEERMAEFEHLKGDRPFWEVRTLKVPIGSKEALLGSREFAKRNSDSYSTGVVAIIGDRMGVRDLREWEKRHNTFLKDVHARRITYYRNPEDHRATKAFLTGLGPEIFSAVRFLNSMFRFTLSTDPESEAAVKEVLRDFDPQRDLTNTYAKKWIERNGSKLFQNAVDLEFTHRKMRELGVREALGKVGGDPETARSLAWWMSLSPAQAEEMRGGDFRRLTGDAALVLDPKVLAAMSDPDLPPLGVAEYFSNLAKGTAFDDSPLGIRMRIMRGALQLEHPPLSPEDERRVVKIAGEHFAKNGFDRKTEFARAWLDLPASKRHPVHVNPASRPGPLGAVEYFSKLAEGAAFDDSPLGARMQVTRAELRTDPALSPEDSRQVVRIAEDYFAKNGFNRDTGFVREWLSLPVSGKSPQHVDRTLQEGPQSLLLFVAREPMAKDLLEDPARGWDRGATLIRRGDDETLAALTANVLGDKDWKMVGRGRNFVPALIGLGGPLTRKALAERVLNREDYARFEPGPRFVEMLLGQGKLYEDDNVPKLVQRNILEKDHWRRRLQGEESCPKLLAALL